MTPLDCSNGGAVQFLTNAFEEAFHRHRNCSPLADCHTVILAIHPGLGGHGASDERFRVGERDRLCSCRGPRGDGMAGNAQVNFRESKRARAAAHWLGLAAALMLAGVPCQAAETSITAIVGATVIHPDRDLPSAVAPDSTVIIAGRRIESIGPASSTAVPAGATRIDG